VSQLTMQAAFEQFAEPFEKFCESVAERAQQDQLAPEHQNAVAEQLKAAAEQHVAEVGDDEPEQLELF
jgi:hypothetical protein